MLEQHLLDLARIDVGATADDDVLGSVLERQVPVGIEAADIPRMQPSVAQSGGGGLRILPISRHHHISATDNFTCFSNRQRAVLAIHDGHLDAGIRAASGGESCLPARMIAVRDVLFRERSDRHRALALPVDLNKPRAETVERAQRILDIHGRAAPDDGANVLRVAVARRIDQPLDHGRRREHGGARPTVEQAKNFGRLKATGFRNDVDAEPRHMRHDVEARAVAHWRRMQDGVARHDRIDLCRIGMA